MLDGHWLLWLGAALCLCVALAYTASSDRSHLYGKKKRSGRITPCSIATLDSDDLYYDRTRWPQYEPRFNLRLASLYGPVICVNTGPTSRPARLFQWLQRCLYPAWQPSDSTILVNSLAEEEGTLKKLLNSCASRETSIAAGKYLSRGRRIVLQPYGPDWARQRKAFSLLLTKDKIKNQWAKALKFEAMILIDRVSALAADAHDTSVVDEVSRFTASSVLQITYARRARTPQDPVLQDLEAVSRNIANAFTPGKYWVEKFPLLEIFHTMVSPWKKRLNADHEFENDLFSRLLRGVEDKLMAASCAADAPAPDVVISTGECAAAQLLRSGENHQLDRDHMAYLAAGLFEAGTETTAMTINAFLLAAACYPQHIQRAQEELNDRMRSRYGDRGAVPGFEDLEELRLLAPLVKEALRLTPTGSSGVGHTKTADRPLRFDISTTTCGEEEKKKKKKRESPVATTRLDVPSRATVLANIYGLHHDPAVYRDPWRFNPERWLDPSSPGRDDEPGSCNTSNSNTLDHTHATHAFGFGRRICPGSALASYSLSMAVALLLHCFDFELTDTAHTLRREMEAQVCGEYEAWKILFGEGGYRALERERELREGYVDQKDRIGRVLIDAYVTFKLSKEQLAQCVCLTPRVEGDGLRAVRNTLATMQHRANSEGKAGEY